MNIKLIAVVAVTAVAVLLTCVACGPSYETAVLNTTSAPLIAGSHDPSNFPDPDPVDRFFVVRPGELVVVDTAGGQDPASDGVVILDTTCQQLDHVSVDFSQGALISIAEGKPPGVILGRASASGFASLVRQDANGLNGDNGFKTCADAVAKLAASG